MMIVQKSGSGWKQSLIPLSWAVFSTVFGSPGARTIVPVGVVARGKRSKKRSSLLLTFKQNDRNLVLSYSHRKLPNEPDNPVPARVRTPPAAIRETRLARSPLFGADSIR